MALSPEQPVDKPGGFGTFDEIRDVNYVRNQLAVKEEWKNKIDKVVTYEVTNPLPVKEGPVGLQADLKVGKYLPGGGSQIQMILHPKDRMKYLRVIKEVIIK